MGSPEGRVGMDGARDALSTYLARLTLRSELGPAEREAVLSLPGGIVSIGDGRDFVDVGDCVDHACLIVDGLVGRFAELKNDERAIVALHVPGDLADLHSVVAPKVAWGLQTMTASTILRIPHKALRELATNSSAIAMAFWKDCVVDANIVAQWTVNIARRDAAARVAHLICEMRERYASVGLGTSTRFPFPITQINFANVVGLTSVHMNRMLRRLREDGLASKVSGEIEIQDWEGLTRLAAFDPAYLQLADKVHA